MSVSTSELHEGWGHVCRPHDGIPSSQPGPGAARAGARETAPACAKGVPGPSPTLSCGHEGQRLVFLLLLRLTSEDRTGSITQRSGFVPPAQASAGLHRAGLLGAGGGQIWSACLDPKGRSGWCPSRQTADGDGQDQPVPPRASVLGSSAGA